MTSSPRRSARRLNDADANFVLLGSATGTPYIPVAVTVYERPHPDEVSAHLTEVMSRLLPAMHQRIAHDRWSPALPRWEDVPGFDPAQQTVTLPAPGDGTLRSVLDWAEEWARLPMPLDLPPWRSVAFEDVTVDGTPGRLVMLSQFHHALIDGMGATRLAEHFYQWGPDGDLPAMPPPVEPSHDDPRAHWREGWAEERQRAGALLRGAGARLRRAAADPRAAAARAKELGAAVQRMQAAQGDAPCSPLLRRTSDRNRFDHLRVDLDALRAGARAVGGSANDGFLAAVALGLHRWHLEHGTRVPELRTAMAVSTRTAEHDHQGNELIGAILGLPLGDDPAAMVAACREVSRRHREDADVLWLMERFRAAGNRLPERLIGPVFAKGMRGFDLSLSNVKGVPFRSWVAGVEVLDTMPFLIGGPAVSVTLVSGPQHASVGIVTCPEAVTDPAVLLARIEQGFADVTALAAEAQPAGASAPTRWA